jgi:hypothetical protein
MASTIDDRSQSSERPTIQQCDSGLENGLQAGWSAGQDVSRFATHWREKFGKSMSA